MGIDWVRLGKDLRADRERRGLSQEQLAQELSLRQSDLSLLERGAKKRPGPVLMGKLRRYLDAASGVLIPSGVPTLPAPDEEAVNDPTFRQVWLQLTAIWKYRNTTTKKQWIALVHNIDTFYEKLEEVPPARRTTKRAGKP